MLPPSFGIVFPQTVGNAGQKGRVDHLYPGIGLDRFLDALSRLSAGRLALPRLPSFGPYRVVGRGRCEALGRADSFGSVWPISNGMCQWPSAVSPPNVGNRAKEGWSPRNRTQRADSGKLATRLHLRQSKSFQVARLELLVWKWFPLIPRRLD